MDNKLIDGFMQNILSPQPEDHGLGILRIDRLDCPIHGLYSSVVIGYRTEDGQEVVTENDGRCHHCVREADEKERQRLEYEEYKDQKISTLLSKNGVTGIFLGVGYDTFQVDQLKDLAKLHVRGMIMAWVAESFRNLIISGHPGTGKTLLASIAVNEACRNMRPALYVTEQKLYRDFRAYLHYPDKESQLVGHYGSINFLVIDELGRSAGTEYEARLLAEIIDDRYRNSKSTLFCTNMSFEELTSYLGDNVIRRLAASGRRTKCEWPPFK